MTTRLGEIKGWIANFFPNVDLSNLTYMQSDASARKYLRLSLSDLSFVIMDTEPGVELNNFVRIAGILEANNVTVPQIINQDLARGLLLMNDFGSTTYLSAMKNSDLATANKLYSDAIAALIKIQTISYKSKLHDLPIMGPDYISNRMNVFNTWYLQQHLKLEADTKVDSMLHDLQSLFFSVFQSQPHVFVHLDYHSRNLMYLSKAGNPGIIDFQDAMYGPATYDLVSLFQDAYITWPRAQVEAWVNLYRDMAREAGVISQQEANSVLRNFDLVGLQRHIKNLGIFARLHYRDKKSSYLQDIPTLLDYIVETCTRYPELSALLEFLKGHILEVSL
jgi:aminoglycoside/choline kinase family phosphotransferase